MEHTRAPFVTITFPNGAVYSVREAGSGIVTDPHGAPIHVELMHDLLAIKMWKLCIAPSGGRVC
jgi:hypothetical protein